jgi:transposase
VPIADPRDIRITELEIQVAARDRVIVELLAKVEALLGRVAELEARLGQNSNNSSKPPSSDSPGARREQKKPPTGRKPGGQPGHQKHERELLPAEKVDRVIDLVPEQCGKCGRGLRGRDKEPRRHQVIDIPPIKPEVAEFRCHELECDGCGATTRAPLPSEAESLVGDRLGGLICLLMGQYRLSKRMVQLLLSDVLGVSLSLGMVPKVATEVSESLVPAFTEAVEFVRKANAANADETGWSEGKKDGRSRRAWLWTFATRAVVVFVIALSRGSNVVKETLGEDFNGFLTTDRWNAYNFYDLALRQLCWSHLTRDIQSFIDRGGKGARIGKALMRERHKMFKWWHRVRDGTLSQPVFQRRMRAVKKTVGRLLRKAVARAEAKTAGMAAEILKLEEAMWTFVEVEGVEPTNNFGERCIRHPVMWRKTSFGTQSPAGSRFVERILTAVTTLKLQKRNVLEFLTETLAAHRRGRRGPSLLPSSPAQLAAAA